MDSTSLKGRETNGYRLLRDLLSGYDTDMRPVNDPDDAVLVTMDITINKILKLVKHQSKKNTTVSYSNLIISIHTGQNCIHSWVFL